MVGKVEIHKWSQIEAEDLGRGISRKFVTGPRLMVAHIELAEGAEVPEHSHKNEQISYVLKGTLRFRIGANGEQKVVSAGELIILPANVKHQVLALSKSISLDIFNPPRQDWIDGTDDYLRQN